MLIALTILLLVLVVGFNFYFYVNRASTVSSRQAAVQFNVRFAKEQIEEIVRLADSMEIFQEWNASLVNKSSDEAIYVDESGSLVHYQNGTPKNLLEGISEGIDYEITFNTDDQVFLCYNISGMTDDGYTYEMSTELKILNIAEDSGIIKNFGDEFTTGSAIVFSFDGN